MSATALPAPPDRPEGHPHLATSAIIVALSMTVAMAIAAIVVAIGALGDSNAAATPPSASSSASGAALPAIPADDPSVKYEPYKTPDATLPPVPPGDVKTFKVQVFEHVTKVADDKPPLRVWSYGVNGTLYRGTGASTPMVVNQGDKVRIELINGGSMQMDVQFPHSIDFHAAEVAPNKDFSTIPSGATKTFEFTADHPGVFMYHCATDPVLMHTGAGMVGMLVVKPKDLAPVDKELWITQQEYYFGDKAGGTPSMEKMQAKQPDVIAFNGYANQYKQHPIEVKKGERIRLYVLNAGPSIWSAFHVIGTVFDTAHTDNGIAHDVQTVNLAPSQGGWVEFTLDEEGNFPFVTHAFGDMVKGAAGVLKTEHSTAMGMGH